MNTEAKKASGKTQGNSTVRAKKNANQISVPSGQSVNETQVEDRIRVLAEAIYRERAGRGEPGTPEEDWLKAEEIVAMIE
ncbi:MAG: DUF2934 domain-containing protein [Bacteroidales bacterium]|nr:DUF2934 domain-containing protein [Bacteroidales bacterium]